MRLVIQVVNGASCKVDDQLTGAIEKGYMILCGIGLKDDKSIVEKMAAKVAKLRIFPDENDKINLDLKAVNGAILSISQFTLYADTRKGNRPSFTDALKGEAAKELYLYFNECLRKEGFRVEEGIFGADMKVALLNDGPLTILLDSEEL